MLKTILLLNPVYVTLFWIILLKLTRDKNAPARKFLGKFMIFAFIIYSSHYIFYYPLKHVYLYIDPLYQLSSLIAFPLYFIYLRILTIDQGFSIKNHWQILITPVLLTLLYCGGLFFISHEQLEEWLFNRDLPATTPGMQYLKIIYLFIRITFILQVIYLIIMSSRLLHQYQDKAEQYYSDEEEGKSNNVKKLNTTMIISGVCSILLALLGRDFFKDEIYGIFTASLTFSILLFIIGFLGFKQKSVITEVSIHTEVNKKENIEINNLQSKKLLEKILDLFENHKIFLNENLNIVDIANLTGTNRTYISHLINHHYHQNFCTFVNTFRVDEVKSYIISDPTCTNNVLAEKCGFSSTDSLKRVVKNMTGMSVTELKSELNK
jgi:AraC-like DNA-binding protein